MILGPGMGARIYSATNDLRIIIGELMRCYGKSTPKEKIIVDNKQRKPLNLVEQIKEISNNLAELWIRTVIDPPCIYYRPAY